MSKEIIFNKDMLIVSETDEKGYITFANDDFCKISGYTLDELIGKPHNILRHKDMPSFAFKDLWETLKAGKIWKGIVKNRTKDGNYYWVNATAYPSKYIDGRLRYISVRVKTTQKELLTAIEQYSIKG
ncbi:PAS domain-containing protein [Arcobacter lanthieri]|uniref:PAS domain-containing protein n=1 Tax=Aliarcobacter lanthieri TaxID=1355374 RepID=UPI001922FF43|nr:PAS domain-containing protein [Aliarcobacter lanthieri]MBL3519911.1 PAS domain-containing protein [Aliarcobacter lanthieri]